MRNDLSIPKLALALGMLLGLTRPADGVPVRISLQTISDARVEGVLKLTPVVAGLQAAPVEVSVVAPGERTVDLKPGMTWQAELSAEGFWGEPLDVLPEKAAEGVSLRVFPTGTVRGRLVPPRGGRIPASFFLRFQSSPSASREKPVQASVLCPVRDDTIHCVIPSGVFDLRLRADGAFAPFYLWGVKVEPGKTLALKDLRLEKGASVSGWIETEDRSLLSGDCRVALALESAPTDDLGLKNRLEGLGFEAKPNERGFFQMTGVPPGHYRLKATQPGSAPAMVSRVEVRPGLETQVSERLVLAKPVSFEIAVEPPVEPYGQRWRIHLLKRSALDESPVEEHRGEASPEGVWQVPGIAPGTYEVQVLGELNTVWHSEFLDIESGEPALRIEVPLLRVRGTVLLGEDPLAATVWLGREGRRLRFDSDAEGRFEGVLPGPGTWRVELRSIEEGWRLAADPVEIQPPKGKSYAEMRIAVPDTTLRGEVVDENGRPLPDVQVVIAGVEKNISKSQVRTDEKGQISIRGLPAGPVSLRALKGDQTSDWVQTVLPEEGESPWVRIVLRPQVEVSGKVVSPLGGVPGAMVMAWPMLGVPMASFSQDVSGPGGSFHLRFPGESTVLNLLVFPPGHALRLTSVVVSPGQTVQIPVEREGGTLVIERSPEGPPPLLVGNGVFVPVQLLFQWTRMQGARPADPNRLVIPNVGAGAYSLCTGGAALTKLRSGEEPPAANCTSGILAPNGELVLRAPAPPPAR